MVDFVSKLPPPPPANVAFNSSPSPCSGCTYCLANVVVLIIYNSSHLPTNDASDTQFNGNDIRYAPHIISEQCAQQSIEHIDENNLNNWPTQNKKPFCAIPSRLNSHHHASPRSFVSPFTILNMLLSPITRN